MPASTATTRESETASEQLRVYCWRHEELERAGCPLQVATAIASRFDVDLHEALALLDRGCPPERAADILL